MPVHLQDFIAAAMKERTISLHIVHVKFYHKELSARICVNIKSYIIYTVNVQCSTTNMKNTYPETHNAVHLKEHK